MPDEKKGKKTKARTKTKAMAKRKQGEDHQLSMPVEDKQNQPVAPAGQRNYFLEKLGHPLVDDDLPSDFVASDEATHLANLWDSTEGIRQYDIREFVHAGGSGLVFRALDKGGQEHALKIVRRKLLEVDANAQDIAKSLSPVSSRELTALRSLSHSSIVQLSDTIASDRGVIAVATSYVDRPQPLHRYLQLTLAETPRRGAAFSPQRLERACAYLVTQISDIADALDHMHQAGFYHFDVKPANLLVSRSTRRTILTDLGACVSSSDVDASGVVRVHFTWVYAHPDLTNMISDPGSISGGGLKASATADAQDGLARYDLYAFGKTIQQLLAVLEREFGERSYACRGFQFLHLIASLLLDGRNAALAAPKRGGDPPELRFVDDLAVGCPPAVFGEYKIRSSADLKDRLGRFGRDYSWFGAVPELDPWQSDTVNTGVGSPSTFTARVAAVMSRPVLRRLKTEPQLGWMRDVYPGAGHSRWAHTLGVLSGVSSYYNSLLADPESATLGAFLVGSDVEHAMVAALLHDVGQMAFAHDFEAAMPGFYVHEDAAKSLLDEDYWGTPTLRQVIAQYWDGIDLTRVLNILRNRHDARAQITPLDGLAVDILDGPIDVDKFDYTMRDSHACGVPYGSGVDRGRFLRALSVVASDAGPQPRFRLAYKSKGGPAIESLLLARYQLYCAVYWHHTVRCIQAMFTHSVEAALSWVRTGTRPDKRVTPNMAKSYFYHRVVCGKRLQDCKREMGRYSLPDRFYEDLPERMQGDRALEFVWRFATADIRALVERLAARRLHKRIFEMRLGELGEYADYSALSARLSPEGKVAAAGDLQRLLMDTIQAAMGRRSTVDATTGSGDAARARYDELKATTMPLLIVDFPTRGVPDERNVPTELADPARKYLAHRVSPDAPERSLFHVIRSLQMQAACIRVFAAPELHELATRYLSPDDVRACVGEVIHELRQV